MHSLHLKTPPFGGRGGSRGQGWLAPAAAPDYLAGKLENGSFLNIFEAHHYRVYAQELIMATGLSLGMIKQEMKYFQTEGIVQSMRGMAPQGIVINRFYILQEPYRSNPERFRARSGQLDLELKEMLLNKNLIV